MRASLKTIVTSRSLIAITLTIVALGCYLLPLHSWGGDDAGGDTGAAELMPIAILRYHAIDFTALMERHPELLDKGELPYYLEHCNGRVVSFYPIIPGLLNVPTFVVANGFHVDLFQYRYLLSMFTAILECAASVGLMFLALEAVFSQPIAAGFTIVYAFGTAVWSVASRVVWQHGSSLLFFSGALAIILRVTRSDGRADKWLPLAGILLGLEVWNRPSSALIVLPLAVYVLHQRRAQAFKFVVAIAALGLLMAVYSYLYCGSVVNLGQGRNVVSDTTGSDGAFQGEMLTGLLGILFSPNRGLFVFDPIFVPAFALLIASFFSRAIPVIYRYFAVATLLTLVCYSRWSMWWGGWSFSYRLLIELLPILIVSLAYAWQRWIAGRRAAAWCFGVCLLYSVAVHFLGAFYYPVSRFNDLPDNIDANSNRLWSVRDGELVRDARLFVSDLKQFAGARFHVPTIPWPSPDPQAIPWSLDNDASPVPSAVSDVKSASNMSTFVCGGPQSTGSLDAVDQNSIEGWAYDDSHPDQPLAVTIFDNGAPLVSVVASKDRPDLGDVGIANHGHGFQIIPPAQLLDGKPHEVSARVIGSNVELNFSPKKMP